MLDIPPQARGVDRLSPGASNPGLAAGHHDGVFGSVLHQDGEQRHQALDPAAERLHSQLSLAVRESPTGVPTALDHRPWRGHFNPGGDTEGNTW